MSSFYLLRAASATRWFDERRGLALALVLVVLLKLYWRWMGA